MDGLKFSLATIDWLDAHLPWCPCRRLALRWMRGYVQSPKSYRWFDDASNFVFCAHGSIYLQPTVSNFLISFDQDAPLFAVPTLVSAKRHLVERLPDLLIHLRGQGVFSDTPVVFWEQDPA